MIKVRPIQKNLWKKICDNIHIIFIMLTTKLISKKYIPNILHFYLSKITHFNENAKSANVFNDLY